MIRKTYSVPDVSCNHCKMTIERALGGLTGIFEVEVDVAAKTVAVAFDDEVIAEEAVLADAGRRGLSGRCLSASRGAHEDHHRPTWSSSAPDRRARRPRRSSPARASTWLRSTGRAFRGTRSAATV